MLRRLLMILLIACLAVPAAAMPLLHPEGAEQRVSAPSCHEAPVHQQHQPARQKMLVQGHDCIGCAASWPVLPAAAPRAELRGEQIRPALARVLGQAPALPEVPPPRA